MCIRDRNTRDAFIDRSIHHVATADDTLNTAISDLSIGWTPISENAVHNPQTPSSSHVQSPPSTGPRTGSASNSSKYRSRRRPPPPQTVLSAGAIPTTATMDSSFRSSNMDTPTKMKHRSLFSTPVQNTMDNAVSYTHLDVYKRQL